MDWTKYVKSKLYAFHFHYCAIFSKNTPIKNDKNNEIILHSAMLHHISSHFAGELTPICKHFQLIENNIIAGPTTAIPKEFYGSTFYYANPIYQTFSTRHTTRSTLKVCIDVMWVKKFFDYTFHVASVTAYFTAIIKFT